MNRKPTKEHTMKKPEITPGKWSANQTSCGFYTVSASILDSNAREALCREVCGASIVEERNNATAIAALPDLLEALEVAYKSMTKTSWTMESNQDARDLLRKADQVQAALSKAGYTFD